jgi:uncharacterized membrane protein YphA (DoxX/SURF4 family)
MKIIVTLSRIIVGSVFIFSGLVKAIDPLGLTYKMQEFFEAWGGMFMKLDKYSFPFSVAMITAEVVLGVALLLGVYKKLTAWLLFLLMLLFTFLTSYVLFSGKIRTCGCFGDCIPLTPIQTFTKDIILLIGALLILFGQKHIHPLFSKAWALLPVAFAGVCFLQYYVLHQLTVKDCLPYKKGNDILALRKMPADATQDKYEYFLFYKKEGVEKEFPLSGTPDSTWTFSRDGAKKLISKGNGKMPSVNDFKLTTQSGNDTTEALLGNPDEYYLLMVRDLPTDGNEPWVRNFQALHASKKIPCYYISSDPVNLLKIIGNRRGDEIPVLTCDGTALKTASRVNATLFFMKGSVIQNKWSAGDIGRLVK